MKKKMWILTVMILALVLAGCQGESAPEVEAGTLNEAYAEDALPIDTQLIVGTIMLKETDLAVNAEMAEELLSLWKMYKSLIESDTTAQAEITALLDQIQDTMTAEQIEAIAAMELTKEDMATLNQEMGWGAQTAPEGTEKDGSGGFGGGQGGLPRGVPGGGGGAGQEGMTPEQIATAQATRQEMGGRTSSMFNVRLAEGLISILEAKIQ